MKVAFCSNDGVYINEHFGRAKSIYIYEVDEKGYSFYHKKDFIPINGTKEHKDSTEAKVESIKECTILYVNEIGGPAAAVTVRNKIHPVKVDEKTEIIFSLEKLSTMLKDNPPLWLKKAIINKSK